MRRGKLDPSPPSEFLGVTRNMKRPIIPSSAPTWWCGIVGVLAVPRPVSSNPRIAPERIWCCALVYYATWAFRADYWLHKSGVRSAHLIFCVGGTEGGGGETHTAYGVAEQAITWCNFYD
jgi:hypothetical protein